MDTIRLCTEMHLNIYNILKHAQKRKLTITHTKNINMHINKNMHTQCTQMSHKHAQKVANKMRTNINMHPNLYRKLYINTQMFMLRATCTQKP